MNRPRIFIHKSAWHTPATSTRIPLSLIRNRNLSFAARGLYSALMAGAVLTPKERRGEMVGRCLRELRRAGFTDHFTVNQGIELQEARAGRVKARVLDGGPNTCQWCGGQCWSLHEHHYPLTFRDWGTETVRICGRCHADFHHLEGRVQ